MKNTFLLTVVLAFVLCLAANHALASGAVKLGIDTQGDHDASGGGVSASTDVDTGISLTGELFTDIDDHFDLGGGISFQLPRSLKGNSSDEFNFVPIYGMVRVKSGSPKIAPYGILQLGYNLFLANSSYKGTASGEADLEGGLYYGIGGGVLLKKHFIIELLYSKDYGKFKVAGVSSDIEYSKITLNLGYNF
jgi:hypothetical protein